MIKSNALTPLNFPQYAFRTRQTGEKTFIFDCVRKKYVSLTPEEWVRQHLIHYLINEKSCPASLLSVETPLRVVKTGKRSDLTVSDRNGRPLMLVECKAPEVAITQKTFEQIIIYNMTVKAACLMVTNGLQHYCFTVDRASASLHFPDKIPDYGELLALRPD